jgi:hypothetical protein
MGSGAFGFFRANSQGAKHDPMKLTTRMFLLEAKNRSATTNFDVIGMRAQAENPKRG